MDTPTPTPTQRKSGTSRQVRDEIDAVLLRAAEVVKKADDYADPDGTACRVMPLIAELLTASSKMSQAVLNSRKFNEGLRTDNPSLMIR